LISSFIALRLVRVVNKASTYPGIKIAFFFLLFEKVRKVEIEPWRNIATGGKPGILVGRGFKTKEIDPDQEKKV
jgi:hypothetical protein